MSLVVLLILAVVWAVFLIPQLVRVRADRGPADTVGAFRSQLSVLERTTPAAWSRNGYLPNLARPTISRSQAARRRRDVLAALLAAMGVTLGLYLLAGIDIMLWVHLALDGLFLSYVVLLARTQAIANERQSKVRYLHAGQAQVAYEPAMALGHSGR